jgi:signal transduction histidine kinase
MLQDFIAANRDRIIERAREGVRSRSAPRSTETKLENGIPLFLTQLVDALAAAAPSNTLRLVRTGEDKNSIAASASLHGHELLKNGFTVAQVVHGYGDVCQAVTELAGDAQAAISPEEFQLFNHCLDDAIAAAVTAYAGQRELDLAYEGRERLGFLAHELRNLLSSAVLSFDVLKRGLVGFGGSTGAIHGRSLSGLGTLIDRTLAEVRLEAGSTLFERVSVVELMEEVELGAKLQADAFRLHLTVSSAGGDVSVEADRQLLLSALGNLIQNAFKFTRPAGHVSLVARVSAQRVLIDVADECGGLPPGKAEELFQPFTQRSPDRSGLGLGLAIANAAVRANGGDLYVRDIPGTGCVFTVDLPLPDSAQSDSRPGASRTPSTATESSQRVVRTASGGMF